MPVLGRWLTFLAERAEHPASSLMLAVTDALALHWATGQSPVEDLNLGALLGWIDPPPGLTGAQAAAAAEDPVRCPPAGPATDPTFDNEVLEARLAGRPHREGTGDGRADAAREGRAHRRAGHPARADLDADVAGGGTAARPLRPAITSARAGTRTRTRSPGTRTTCGTAARRSRAATARSPPPAGWPAGARPGRWYAAQRAFDDPLVMAEHRMTGEAFAGQVTAAEPDRVDASGPRRVLRPRITVETGDVVLAEPGSSLTSPARPNQKARVVSVTAGRAIAPESSLSSRAAWAGP